MYNGHLRKNQFHKNIQVAQAGGKQNSKSINLIHSFLLVNIIINKRSMYRTHVKRDVSK